MLDRIPLPLRDLLFLVLPVVLGWAGEQGVPWLSAQHPALSYGLAAAVAAAGAWLTPATRAYGLGRSGAHVGPPEATSGPVPTVDPGA